MYLCAAGTFYRNHGGMALSNKMMNIYCYFSPLVAHWGERALWAILESHTMPTSYLKMAPSKPPSRPPHPYIKERQQQPPSTSKKCLHYFCPSHPKGKVSPVLRARELIVGSNWGEIQFPIRWCRLQGWCPHQFRTLTVERSPLSALVTKLAFLVSI